jgi:hypothetical protein
MRLKTLLALVAVLVLVSAAGVFGVSLLTQDSDRNSSDVTGEPTGPRSDLRLLTSDTALPYAYATSTELVVVRANREIARVPRIFDAALGRSLAITWTHSGRYVAFTSDAKERQEEADAVELVSIDTVTGEESRYPCRSCDQLAPLGEHGVVADPIQPNDERSSLVSQRVYFDLETAEVADMSSTMPFRFGFGTTREHGLAVEDDYIDGGRTREIVLTLVTSQGADVTSFRYRTDPRRAVSQIRPSPNNDGRIAVELITGNGLCPHGSFVQIIDTSGDIVRTGTPTVEPESTVRGRKFSFQFNDMWWGLDGHLYATINSWFCDDNARTEAISHSRAWRLDGQNWVKVGDDHVSMRRELDDSSYLELAIPDCKGDIPVPSDQWQFYCNVGSLHLVIGADRQKLESDVISIYTPTAVAP